MKVAVCLYGYPRHAQIGARFLGHFFDGIEHDFFIHAWYDPNESIASLDSTQNEISGLFKPVEFVLQKQLEFKKTFDFPHDLSCLKPELVNQNIGVSTFLSMLYSMKQVGELLQRSPNDYELVVLTRTDVFSHNQLKNYTFNSYDEIYSSFCHGGIWDLNNGGEAIDTKMISSNRKNMESLMNIYEFVEDYIAFDKIKVCHHRILAHHLKKMNQKFHMMFPESGNWFYLRSNGLLHGEKYDSDISNYANVFK